MRGRKSQRSQAALADLQTEGFPARERASGKAVHGLQDRADRLGMRVSACVLPPAPWFLERDERGEGLTGLSMAGQGGFQLQPVMGEDSILFLVLRALERPCLKTVRRLFFLSGSPETRVPGP